VIASEAVEVPIWALFHQVLVRPEFNCAAWFGVRLLTDLPAVPMGRLHPAPSHSTSAFHASAAAATKTMTAAFTRITVP